jgi:hypothetical protein
MVFLVASGLAAAQAGDRLALGIKDHDAALAGDEVKVVEALRLLGPEGWDRPPLALAYHGSALTLEASFAKKKGSLMKALSLIDEGTKEIDSAISLDPGDIELRKLRMENSVSLVEASPVDRKPEAAGDIACLRTRWAELQPEERALVELDSGRLALAERRLGDANVFWRKAVREAPGSPSASRAKKLLARYGD